MATTSTPNPSTNFVPDFEAATERAVQATERLAEASRKVTNAYLDGVEKYVAGVVEFERKLGAQTQVEPWSGFVTAHAQLTEDLTRASVRAVRELVTQ